MMKWIQPLALGIALVACSGQEAAELTVDEVLARHVEATGGAEAIDGLRNLRLAVEVVEPDFTVNGDYRATRDGRMQVDIFADSARVFSEGIDEQGGWQQGGDGGEVTQATGLATAILARGIDFNIFGLHDLEERGHRAVLRDPETIDGTDYQVVELIMADGFQRRFYINSETWLIERHREVSALHPDLDAEERPAETVEGDYRAMCGVLRSTTTRKIDLETGEEIQRTRVTDFDCNVDPATLEIARYEDE